MASEIERAAPVLRSIAERARQAGVHPQTLEAEIREGRLRVTRIRRRQLIHDTDFNQWLDRCRGVGGEGEEGTSDAA